MDHPTLYKSASSYLSDLSSLSENIRSVLESMLIELARYDPQRSRPTPLAPFPEVKLTANSLYVSGVFIPCSARPLTFKLLKAFFKGDSLKASRESIMREVYGDRRVISARLLQSHECNLNKLMSRTRRYIHESLSTARWTHNVDWLVFDHKEKMWNLIALRP